MSHEYKFPQPVQASIFDCRFAELGFSIKIDEYVCQRTKGTIYFTENSASVISQSDGTVMYLEAKIWVNPQPFLLATKAILGLTIYSENDPEFWGFATEAEMFNSIQKACNHKNITLA